MIAFIMPREASAGRYRVMAALSAPVHVPFVFWWPSTAFEVGSS